MRFIVEDEVKEAKVNHGGINSYQISHIQSASRGKLVVIAYNALISSMLQAKKLIEEKPVNTNGEPTWFEKVHRHLAKARDILVELMKVLNFKQGGEIAKNLYSLYIYIYELLIDADMRKVKEPVDTALNFLIPLRDAYEEADKEFRKESRR